MLRIPYFFEGITNIFKPSLTDKQIIEKVKSCENYIGKVDIDLNLCVDCGQCVEVCPTKAISKEIFMELDSDKVEVQVKHEECINCGLCIDFCVTGAITLVKEV